MRKAKQHHLNTNRSFVTFCVAFASTCDSCTKAGHPFSASALGKPPDWLAAAVGLLLLSPGGAGCAARSSRDRFGGNSARRVLDEVGCLIGESAVGHGCRGGGEACERAVDGNEFMRHLNGPGIPALRPPTLICCRQEAPPTAGAAAALVPRGYLRASAPCCCEVLPVSLELWILVRALTSSCSLPAAARGLQGTHYEREVVKQHVALDCSSGASLLPEPCRRLLCQC
jgi:hypothetical protein